MLRRDRGKKLLIGVTGGIGAGKSLACKYFAGLGCEVFFADLIAKQLYITNKSLKSSLVSEFGSDILENKSVSLTRLRELVFNNSKNQKRVNKIVHPFVFKEFAKFVKKSSSKIIIHEAALIFESGLNKKLDYVINIPANKKLRIQRVHKRGLPLSVIKNIMSMQFSDKERNEMSDFIIKNNGTRVQLKKQVKLMSGILESLL